MKKATLLLALLVASLCSLSSTRAATRTAPAMPTTAVAPESGKSYYLYNVVENKWLCTSTQGTRYPAVGTYGAKVVLTETDKGWTVQFATDNYYIHAYDTYTYTYSYDGSPSYFTFATSGKGYTIRRATYNSSYYKADEYLGFDGTVSDRVKPNLAEGSIHWKFYETDVAEHYFAQLRLYTALQTADPYNFNIDRFEAVYADAGSSTDFMNQAAEELTNAIAISGTFVSPDWSDYNILFQNPTGYRWEQYNSKKGLELYCYNAGTYTSTLRGTVVVDKPSTLVFNYNGDITGNLRVSLDGTLVQEVNGNQGSYNSSKYFVEMVPGKHDIEWTIVANKGSNGYTYYNLDDIGVEITPTITVNLLEPGSLGTEVLYNVDHVKDVRKLVVKGAMNSDDWARIMMMTSLFTLDLTEAEITEIPEKQLSRYYHSSLSFFHEVKLPKGLKKIGANAFERSYLTSISFPETLESIGEYAFCRTNISEALLPESVTAVGEYAFSSCYLLRKASWPKPATTIPEHCFNECYVLHTFEIPEGVTTIQNYAFWRAVSFNPRFPKSLTTIGRSAFSYAATDSLFINEGVSMGDYAFNYCSKLVYASFPTSQYLYTSAIRDCSKLKDLYLKSPTVIANPSGFLSGCPSTVTVHVPQFLVNSYKLDSYWYNYTIEGFSTADVKDWTISRPLTLNARDRFEGKPNLTLGDTGALKINGDAPMTINNLFHYTDQQLLSNCENIVINGTYKVRYYTEAKKWYFLSFPFDIKVGDIVPTGGAKYAIRYYDGANRAANGTGGNWKNYKAEDIIPAGTGFIYQTSAVERTLFTALENAAKQNAVSCKPFVKALAENASDNTSHQGWNLVGNPWQCYFNIHKLNFTAPITVWSGSGYAAYSVIDDDYAIRPNQAFFVQCPEEVNSIGFPTEGRQLTSTIESQNAVRVKENQDVLRRLFDLELTDGNEADKTRVVLNEAASTDYEMSCDASKFFTMMETVPQLYSLGTDGTEYAINERPLANGNIALGVVIPADGTYTFRSVRNDLSGAVVLTDLTTGEQTDLATSDYTFHAEEGTYTTRFVLGFEGAATTGIATTSRENAAKGAAYDLQGRRVADRNAHGVFIQGGKKVVK